MTQISISQLKLNPEKYIILAQSQDILIMKNGKVAAKLITAKPNKIEAMDELFGLFPDGIDEDVDKAKKERLE